MRKHIVTSFVLVAAVLALLLFLLWGFQRRLIYFPFPRRVPAASSVLPGAEEVSVLTADGQTLGAWFIRAHKEPPVGTVLVLNGNAGNRSFRAPLAEELSRGGYAVLLVDYRGYGGNAGEPSEAGLLEDAKGARAWLERREGVDPERIVYFGESLGSAVALALAVERPPAALILRSPFTSLADAGRVHYPFLPVRLLLADRYDSLAQVARVSCPLLVIAGEQDRIVPTRLSRRVYEAASGRKRLAIVPGADHNDFALLAGEQLMDEVLRFLEEVLDATR